MGYGNEMGPDKKPAGEPKGGREVEVPPDEGGRFPATPSAEGLRNLAGAMAAVERYAEAQRKKAEKPEPNEENPSDKPAERRSIPLPSTEQVVTGLLGVVAIGVAAIAVTTTAPAWVPAAAAAAAVAFVVSAGSKGSQGSKDRT
jgi:hypothetical protein